MKVLIAGYGSIGKRHASNLASLGIHDIILYREQHKGNDQGYTEIYTYQDILDLKVDFVVISNPTNKHFGILDFLMRNQVNILCEKPLVSNAKELNNFERLLGSYQGTGRVAFNMRFHPVVRKALELLKQNLIGHPRYARFIVGQYLPDWRPGMNHLESYSAFNERGGGVVLDLIHEIDLASFLIGSPSGEVSSVVERISDVTYDSEDIAEILYKTDKNEIINIHLDYLYRGYIRKFLIAGAEGNIHGDMYENTIKVRGTENEINTYEEFPGFKKNTMYTLLIEEYMKELHGKTSSRLPSFEDSVAIMKTVLEIKKSYEK